MPNLQPALNFVSLVNTFFNYREWFEQHSNVFQSLRYLHDELDIIDVVFRQIAVAQVNAALEIRVICGHVVRADQVVDTVAGPADSSYDVVPGLNLGDIRAHSFHLAEAFMADNEKVVSRRCCAVFGGVNFLVGAIHTDPEDFH